MADSGLNNVDSVVCGALGAEGGVFCALGGVWVCGCVWNCGVFGVGELCWEGLGSVGLAGVGDKGADWELDCCWGADLAENGCLF